MAEDYKISLGVKLDISDIQTQVDAASGNIKPIELKVDAETKELTNTIKEALNSLSKGTKDVLKIDTSEIKKSLDSLSSIVEEIKRSLGTLDGGDMKSLVTSINQMATALGKAENESDSLVKSLSALSKKDFSLNIGLDMGKKNNNMIAYGRAARKQVIPELEAQAKELEKLLGGQQAAMKKLTSQGGKIGFDVFTDFNDFNSESAIKKMEAMEKYINSLKKLAALDNIKLDGFNEVHRNATELINDIAGVEDAVDKAGDVPEKIKKFFGSGIDAESLSASLEPITKDLTEIREAVVNLSKGISLEGLTSSFDRLSESIENLLANAEKVKGVLNSGFDVNGVGGNINSVKSPTTATRKRTASETDNYLNEQLQYWNIKGEDAKTVKAKFKSFSDVSSLGAGNEAYDAALDDLTSTLRQLGKVYKKADDEAQQVLNDLKERKIKAPKDIYGAEFGDDWAHIKRTYKMLRNEGLDVDSAYMELSGKFPSYFPDNIWNQADQLRQIIDVYDKVKKASKGGYVSLDDDEYSRAYLRDEVLDIVNTIQEQSKAEQQLAQASIQSTNTIVQNKEKEQQEYRESLLARKQELEQTIQLHKAFSERFQDDIAHPSPNDTPEDLQRFSDEIDKYEDSIKRAQAELNQIDAEINQIGTAFEKSYDKISRSTSLTRDVIPGDDFKKSFEATSQAAQEAQRHFQELLADEKAVVSVTEQFDDNNALQSFAVNIKRATGEVETLRYAMEKLDDAGDEGFIYQGAFATDSNVEKQIEARIKKANDLQIKLDKIKAGYSDTNASKSIKDANHLESLNNQYDKVVKAIVDVRNADNATSASMISNAEKEKTALENMVREYKNAENVATSLRSKDINTVGKTYESNLDVLISKMRKDGVYTSGFESGAENLRSMLSSAVDNQDKAGLISFLNGLDKLEAGYKRASASVKEFNQAQKVGINVSGLESKIADIQRISPEIDRFEVEINGAKVSVQSLLNDLKQVKTQGDFSVVNSRFKAFADAAKAAGIAIRETAQKAKSINDIKIKLEDTGFNGFKQEVQRAHLEAEKLEGSTIELEVALKRLDVAMDNVYSADQANDTKRLVAANEEYENALKQVYSQLKLNQQAEKNTFNAEMLAQRKASLSSEMEIWLKENTRAAKDFGEEIRRLQASLNGLDDNGVKLVGQQFKNITKQAQIMGKTGLTVFDKLKSKVKEYAAYISAAEIFMYAEQAFREMFNTVKEIDTAMTGLYRVTDLTAAEYDSLFNEMINSAKEYGATLNDIINATTDWVRAGFDANTSLGLAEVTTMYQHISDLDYDTAAENLITAYNGFKDELNGAFNGDTVGAVNYIADILNELDNNYAATSAGIGEALTRSASALDLAGNSIQETAGMITGIIEVTQDPEQAGSTLKILSLRLRGMKGQLEELGEETDENVENISKMQGQILNLTNGKVNIFDGAGEFRSTYEIMKDISEVWDELNSTAQADLLETIAGKHRANSVAALMSNWENVEAAVKSATEAEGSAAKENAKYVDSIQGRLDKLTTTWQSFANTFMESDFLKGAIGALTDFVEGLEKAIDTLGLFPTLLSAFSIYQSFKGGGFIKPLIDEATGASKGITNIFSEAIRKVNNTFKEIGLQKDGLFKTSIDDDIAAFDKYKKAVNDFSKLGLEVDDDAFNKIFENASNSAKEFAKSGKLASEGVDAFVNSQKAAEVATLAQNKSLGNASAIIKEYYGGCKNVQMSQADFAAAVGKTNPQLATQLTTSKSAAGAMAGYTASLVGAKIAATALKVAAMALNAVISYGIGILISFVVEGIMSWINAEEELADRVEEVTSKYKEQHKELQKLKGGYDTSNESSMISKYEKLSKGVDHLGRNVSLTTEEYSEYQNIVNQIADQIPSLITGYDSQGNALLSCKDNVEELTKAYEKLIQAQNDEVLRGENVKDITKDFKNAVNEAEKFKNSKTMNEDGINALEKILSSKNLDEAIDSYASTGSVPAVQIVQALKDEGLTKNDGTWWKFGLDAESGHDFIKRAITENRDVVQRIVDNWNNDLEVETEGMKSIAQAALSNAFDISDSDYWDMSDTMKNVAKQIVNGFDFDFYAELLENENYDGNVEAYINDMLDQLKAIGKEDSAQIEAAFDLQTQFNGGEISYGEYVKGLEDTGNLIDNLSIDKEFKSQFKLSIGLDEDGFVKEYQTLKNRLADSELFNIMPSEYEPFLNDLSAEELSVLIDIIPELSETDYKETLADIEVALNKEMMLQGLTFELNLEAETLGIEALNTALSESVSASGLSSDSITALKGRYADLEAKGYDLSILFEETSHGIHLNRQEFNKLEKAYATDKLAKVDADLAEMKNAYDDLGEAIKNTDDPVRKAELYNDRQTLAKKISEAATLAAQYEGLTSAYNDWLAAEEAGQERDMYENVIEGFENIGDEISRGWYDDGTIEFLEMLTGRTDLAGKSAKELKKVYDGLDKSIKYIGKDGKVLEDTGYSVRDFFTVDDEGNATADGVYNFLDAIGKLEEEAFGGKDVVKRDKNGKIIAFDFKVAGGDEAIAEALGVSEELVQIMVRAADDAGFVVSMDGTYKQLADLQNEARESAEYLKSIGKTDFEFDFNTENVSSLKTQLEEAHKILKDKDFWNKDGTFNFNAKGATEAMQIVSTLQAKVDKLSEEKYGIGLTVEDEEFEEPLENLQEYGRTVQTLNQLELNPEANSEEIDKLEGELEGIAKYFAELDNEKKVKIGLVTENGKTAFTEEYFNSLSKEKKIEIGLVNDKGEPLTDYIDAVQKKIESGDVTIPTVLDIQANMDKNIETLADLALLESGLLSESEEKTIKQKYNVEVEADKVDTSDVDNKVKGAVEDSTKETGTTRKQNIEIIADVFGIEDVDDLISKLKGLDDKTIQAIAEVLGRTDVEKLQQTMALIEPKKVQAIAEAIGKGDVDGLKIAINQLSPKQVQAIAEALGYSDVNELNGAIDSMDGNTVQAVAQALGLTDVNTLQSAVTNMHGNTVDAKVNTDGQASKIDTLQTKINSLKGRIVNVGVQIANGGKKKAAQRTGADPAGNDSEVNGTANVNGTTGRAYKQGSWGTKNSGTALVGELGREVLVRNGRYYTIGDNGAEFIKYKKGDIIFNHIQSEELFKNGKVTSGGGRARAFINGTAFPNGSTGNGGNEGDYGGSAVGSNDDKDKFEETFDWLDILLSRLERTIDNLDKTVNDSSKTWSNRNTALASEITKVGDLIDEIGSKDNANSIAGKYYIQAGKSLNHDSDIAKKIRGEVDSGLFNIKRYEDETDEATLEKIKEYQKWYELYLDMIDKAEDLKRTEAELYAQRFENVQSKYDGILQGFEHTESMLNEYISQAEAKGHIVSKKYYNALIENEKQNINTLKQEQSALIAERDKAVKDGKIAKYSESWYEMCAEIDGVTQAIEEGRTALIEYDNAMRDIDWQVFDLIQERISDVAEEANFLIDLMSYDKLFDDNGKLTDKGMATMGLHGQNYNTYMYAADEYGKEVANLDTQIAKDPYDQELINRRQELVELQRESILAAEDEKQAIKDLVEEGINLELDALQERIDLHNEELDSMKDLYDYQKQVQEQSEEIATLEKQRAAYLNDTSESGRAKLQEITVSLKEARENLQETEYDRYISDQSALLDSLYEEYELILNERLDNLDGLVSDVITEVNNNASTISSTLSTEASNVGTTLSEAMKSIWNTDGAATKIVGTYGDKLTTINTTLESIKKAVNKTAGISDEEAKGNIGESKTQSSVNADPTKGSNSGDKGNNGNNGNGKPAITDKTLKGIAAAIWVYGHKAGWEDDPTRKNKLTNKLGATNAKKVQQYINSLSASGKLTSYWYDNKLKLADYSYSAFKSGAKLIDETQLAWTQENGKEFIVRPSDGAILTPIAKGDSVLTSAASSNIWDMANSPAEFIKDNLNLGVANVPNNSNVQNNIVQNLDKVVFHLPNVKNYDELVDSLQKDPKFDKLVKAMTIDQIAGKSSLAKNKSIR